MVLLFFTLQQNPYRSAKDRPLSTSRRHFGHEIRYHEEGVGRTIVTSWEIKVALAGLASMALCILAAHYVAAHVPPASVWPTPVALAKPIEPSVHEADAPISKPEGVVVPTVTSSEGEDLPLAPVAPPVKEVQAMEGERVAEVQGPEEGEESEVLAAPEGEALVAKSEVEQLHEEVSALRNDMRGLQETLDHLINRVMASLEEENAVLKQELKQFYALQEQQGVASMPGLTPRPYSAIFDALRQEARAENPMVEQVAEEPVLEEAPPLDAQEAPETASAEKPIPTGPFSFTPMKEWGRTAEQAANLGSDVASLKGVVGVVPEGSGREDIEKLGRDLRKEYESFDNVNIEVFDTEEAATQFLEQGRSDTAHRVLSVSRHRQSGRDIILYLGEGLDEPVPLEDPSSAVSPPAKPKK